MKQCCECGRLIADDDAIRWYDEDFCSLRCVKRFRGEWREEYEEEEENE